MTVAAFAGLADTIAGLSEIPLLGDGGCEVVTIQTIRAAVERVRNAILVSPFARSETFSQLTGNSILLKFENRQVTGSFKERGALNKILLLNDEERRRGVIAASAGNHAQAVAYHAAKRGIAAQICMPLTTPLVKVSATRGYGAEVILFGANYDEACQEAIRRCNEQRLTFIHPFDDEAVIAGQGTLGIEMLEQVGDLGRCGDSGRWRRADRRRGLRGEGDGAARSGDRRANFAVTVDESRRRKACRCDAPADKTIADGIAVRTAGTHHLAAR